MRIKTPQFDWQTYNFGTISLCMIMRNEAKVLKRCIDSVRGLVNDIIICDTGSTDGSIEIAKSLGCKVFQDPWQDDFSKPRNISISAAKSDWILVLDPDELILKEHHNGIKWLTKSDRFHSFWLTTYNYGPRSYRMDYKLLPKGGDPLGRFPGYVPSTKTRFFRNGYGIRFEVCYHELADWHIRRNKLLQGSSPIPIQHWTGEISQKSEAEKKAFYLKLGEKKVKEWPKHAQARWELATSEMAAGLRERACKSLKAAWQLGFNRQDMYYSLSRCQRMLGNKEIGDLAFEKGVCVQYPALTHVDQEKKPLTKLLDKI